MRPAFSRYSTRPSPLPQPRLRYLPWGHRTTVWCEHKPVPIGMAWRNIVSRRCREPSRAAGKAARNERRWRKQTRLGTWAERGPSPSADGRGPTELPRGRAMAMTTVSQGGLNVVPPSVSLPHGNGFWAKPRNRRFSDRAEEGVLTKSPRREGPVWVPRPIAHRRAPPHLAVRAQAHRQPVPRLPRQDTRWSSLRFAR